MMNVNPIQQRINDHKATGKGGVVSVCSANPDVIIAAAKLAAQYDDLLLVESTSNQVDQFGGYTGMKPAEFVAYVKKLLIDNGLSADKLVLGGDHLGPNAWQDQDSVTAMNHSEELIRHYVNAGYQKIHLDCSMSCSDDPVPLTDEIVAERAARLCKIAEDTAKATNQPHDIVYIIGTEVPVPGGAQEDLDVVTPTTPEAARTTYQVHKAIFEKHGLGDVWSRIVGLVVQPGVEFDHHSVVDYTPEKADKLSALANEFPNATFEAHSTDYQKPLAFQHLVRDHFAILKVGPALTFALREAYFALDHIAQDMQLGVSSFKAILEEIMMEKPKYWKKYYLGNEQEQRIARAYSLSDRCRYYLPEPKLQQVISEMKTAFAGKTIPLGLLKQYMPVEFDAVREGKIKGNFEDLVHFHIQLALLPYYEAAKI
ncbi:class II D-tagatose-bisphosphate aldolase, non-catalytic subunit [Pasteurella skyensis]|uniref:Class II D-tagatose-bisphosphate aldolase, non-catalytic subunit n=1 Tax=Phocoenobacter skyensis TaxID=97481 RepID=A0AAJ6N987_9PAST|nr:class II D-tagatose-bisphosphate aldolase, non-catalytic subunit [Pasteurella skyensis]MDP8162871.1 class II D-tagatose-bisphosphate aldolase, non-catalytic subunit [Pasteurella skyensis]MDP8172542.1 class II D-tagatose-bisphosphate aldolase, non-catalytic subunit [Pasteurella skyensis]MDP8177695.1 class II D-tagatose-bisphosphate aldolase, non-catalytic subunit [Pasteurella skyensis]MDP8179042.1 class II D-tagatose-bisphosphate aldolase, non-catalytic subunit [Pasteurella skyensis]MDP81832